MKFDRLLARYTYQGQFLLENLLPGLRGVAIGSNLATIDMSGVTTLTLPSGTTIGGSSVVALATITSSSANALTVGPSGTTNPSFNVDASTASAITGLNVKSAATGNGVALTALGGTNELITLDTKGTGTLGINTVNNSAGLVTIGNATNAAGLTVIGPVILARTTRKVPIIATTLTAAGSVQNTTPTAAQLLGGYYSHTSVTGAGTATLDTGTNISSAVTGVSVGDSFTCLYANIGTQTVTITTNTGLTLVGTAAIPTLKNALLTFYNTGANAWNVYITLSA